MDIVLLSRWQFAITTIYHFFFVPTTLGLSVLIALFESVYVLRGVELYKRMAKFWGKILVINFAAGVVTGIVQEFHFGMNWSEYARFMGDIFGVPLAIEALLAFYLESVFLGLWIFGWDRVSKGVHLAAAWLVALASNISALWILMANSFMQHPVGYTLENGRAVMSDFWALLTNPNLPYQFLHVFFVGVACAGFLLLGFSAWHVLRTGEQANEVFTRSFRWAAVYAVVGSFLLGAVGHLHGQFLGRVQPMKVAAAEAHWETAQPADFIVVAWIDEQNRTNPFEIKVPAGLSFLLYNNFTGQVPGLKDLQAEVEAQYWERYGPANYIPPVTLTFWTFRFMVGAGFLMVFLAGLAVVRSRWKFLQRPWFLRLLLPTMALPYLAATAGWILTEEARQPWIVYGLQKVEEGISPNLTVGSVLFSLIFFTLLLTALTVLAGYLIYRSGTAQPQQATEETVLY